MRVTWLILLLTSLLAPARAGAEVTTLRVASLMLQPVKWDKDANQIRLDQAIRAAKQQGAELIVTPEGALEGYVVNEVIRATGEERKELTARFNALAEPCDGPYVQHFRKLCGELKVYLVLGFLEVDAGKTYNTAILIRPDGTIAGKYRKTHFAQGYSNGDEKGDNPSSYLRGTEYPVLEIRGRKMGIMICYDRREPVVAQRLVANGAEFIINPAYGMMGDCNCEFLTARASETHVPILFVHPDQTVYATAQAQIELDLRPQNDGPRVATVSVSVSHHTTTDGIASDGRAELREEFLRWRFGMFLHFNMATYIDREWANGYEDPALFKPDRLDCGQWLDLAVAAGMRYAVLTVKHTGGWCLWDSKETTHDIASFVNYKNGKGDIVREFVDACRQRKLKVGFYYCFPGDFSQPGVGHAISEEQPDLHGLPPEAAGDFVGFIKRQLTELLTNYGPIDLLWIDQYSNKYTYADWPEILAHIRALQPNCIVIGNNAHNLTESDIYSCELPWDPNGMVPEGNTTPAEVCDKISRTWFWNTSDTPGHVKSVQMLTETLSRCNERRANYLLNVPPDRSGQISGAHLNRLRELAPARTGALDEDR